MLKKVSTILSGLYLFVSMKSVWFACLFCLALSSQAQIANFSSQGFLFTPNFAIQVPHADLAERFRTFASIGLGINYKTKSNFMFGVDYDWYFGNRIKESGTFSEITIDSGQIIDSDGNFSIVRLNIKGNYLTANVGYLFNLPKDEPNSGILIQAGVGWMQHKIDIVSSQNKIPQINGEYEKGYDKLTYGIATKQFVGYQHLVNKNHFHFRIGLEFNQGFTQGRRTWDFNKNESGLDKRFDGTIAIKAGIVVPVFTKAKDDEEFFID